MTMYTVIGIWEDDSGCRFADSYDTATPEEAEQAARDEYETEGSPALVIAGVCAVVNGVIEVVA